MSLLKCVKCGELFSDSYKCCPFCAEDEDYYNGKVTKRRRRVDEKKKTPSIVGPVVMLVVVLLVAAGAWCLFDGNLPGVVPSQDQTQQGDQQQDETTKPVEKLTLDKTVLNLVVGQSEDLKVSGVDEDADCLWQNSDPGVVALSETGSVSAVAEGSAVVTVTVGDESATCAITVKEKAEGGDEGDESQTGTDPVVEPDPTVDISKIAIGVPLYGTELPSIEEGYFDMGMGKGESFELEVRGTEVTPQWSVGNSSIASVSSDGTVKGITSGETTITVKLNDAEVKIRVTVS